jgi:type I restriction enzyme S subunit
MVPSGWDAVEAQDICERISVGIVVKPKDYYVPEGEGIKAFRSANVREGFIQDGNWTYISEHGHQKNKKSILKAGDVLVVRTGYPGTACVVTPEYEGTNCIDLIFARPDKTKVLPEFLCEFTNSEYGQKQVLDGQGGLAQQHFNVGAFNKLRVPLPPLHEQRKIADILSTWDRAIETTEALLATARTQKRALMQSLLTGKRRFPEFEGQAWKEVRLGDLGNTFTGLTGKTKDDFGEGLPYIPYLNIFQNSRIDTSQFDYVSVGQNERQNRVQFGDIFFTTSSETPDEVGMASVLLDDIPDLFLNSFCFGFRLHDFETLRPRFARFFLRGQDFRRALHRLAQGATRYNLSKTHLLDLNLVLPPVEEQERIADVLETAQIEEADVDAQIKKLRTEKKALMQQLLTGKRRVVL